MKSKFLNIANWLNNDVHKELVIFLVVAACYIWLFKCSSINHFICLAALVTLVSFIYWDLLKPFFANQWLLWFWSFLGFIIYNILFWFSENELSFVFDVDHKYILDSARGYTTAKMLCLIPIFGGFCLILRRCFEQYISFQKIGVLASLFWFGFFSLKIIVPPPLFDSIFDFIVLLDVIIVIVAIMKLKIWKKPFPKHKEDMLEFVFSNLPFFTFALFAGISISMYKYVVDNKDVFLFLDGGPVSTCSADKSGWFLRINKQECFRFDIKDGQITRRKVKSLFEE